MNIKNKTITNTKIKYTLQHISPIILNTTLNKIIYTFTFNILTPFILIILITIIFLKIHKK